jgi:hypothetical protein
VASQIVDNIEQRKGSVKMTKADGNRVEFSATYHFKVWSENPYASREEILLLTPGLPIVGLNYSAFNMICTSKGAERSDVDPSYWDVTCEFSNGIQHQEPNPDDPENPDPTTWIPICRIDGFVQKQKTLDEDYTDPADGNVNFGITGPYVYRNSAFQPFNPPLTTTVSLPRFAVSQYEPEGTGIIPILKRNNKINAGNTRIATATFPPLTLLCEIVSAELGNWGNVRCWRVDYALTYDEDTWKQVVMDVGDSYLDGVNLKPYYDSTNTVRQTYGKLNGLGGKNAGDPVFLTFRPIDRISFGFIRSR